MKIKILVAAVATILAGSAMAQSAFVGAYGQVATGFESNTITNTGGTLSGTDSNGSGEPWRNNVNGSNQTASGAPIIAGLGYNFAINKEFLLGLGIDYSLLSQKTGTYSTTIVGDSNTVLGGQQMKVSNRLNVFIAPGYAIDKNKLVYFKAGYSQQKLDYTGGQTFDGLSPTDGTTVLSNQSKTQTGYIIGLGYKQIISGGLYGFAEGNYMGYGQTSMTSTMTAQPLNRTNTNTLSPGATAYNLLVGLGYKF